MVYFYHRYELPIVELFISRTQQQNRGGGNSNNNPNNSNPLNIEAMVTNLIQLQVNTLSVYLSPSPTVSLFLTLSIFLFSY